MYSIIAAIGKNGELGKNNSLIWHIPGDLPRFKRLTWGHPVIMGRNTHGSFQYKGGPLPGRTNIILTSNTSFTAQGFAIAHSLEDAIDQAKRSPGNDEIFFIGGASVFAQAMPIANRLYLTKIDSAFDADAFFTDYSRFSTVVSRESHEAGGYRFTYYVLESPLSV